MRRGTPTYSIFRLSEKAQSPRLLDGISHHIHWSSSSFACQGLRFEFPLIQVISPIYVKKKPPRPSQLTVQPIHCQAASLYSLKLGRRQKRNLNEMAFGQLNTKTLYLPHRFTFSDLYGLGLLDLFSFLIMVHDLHHDDPLQFKGHLFSLLPLPIDTQFCLSVLLQILPCDAPFLKCFWPSGTDLNMDPCLLNHIFPPHFPYFCPTPFPQLFLFVES